MLCQSKLLEHYKLVGDDIICIKPAFNKPHLRDKPLSKSLHKHGYLMVTVFGKTYPIHKVMWVMVNGDIPDGYLVDHKDTDKTNNSLSNLRLSTHQQNMQNVGLLKGKSTNLPKGIRMNGNSFIAGVSHNRKEHRRTFKKLDDAIKWITEMRDTLHGEFANHG